MVTIELLLMMALALVARLLVVPRMMYSKSAGVRFGLGCLLFVMYTLVCFAMMRYLCCMPRWIIVGSLMCRAMTG